MSGLVQQFNMIESLLTIFSVKNVKVTDDGLNFEAIN